MIQVEYAGLSLDCDEAVGVRTVRAPLTSVDPKAQGTVLGIPQLLWGPSTKSERICGW